MRKRSLALLLALLLCFSLLSGCKKDKTAREDPAATGSTAPGGTDGPTQATDPADTQTPTDTEPVDLSNAPKRLLNAGSRDYAEDGYVDMINFRDMEYVRPDTDELCAQFEQLAKMAEQGDDPDKILTAYYAASDAFLNFKTMDSLAYIRYTLNTNDNYFKDEYDALELASSDISEKAEAFYKACANSPVREALERDYFGYGYFDKYEDYEVFTNPEYLALKKQEDELLAEYRSALQDPQIEFNGKTQSYYDLLEQYDDIQTYSEYMEYISLLESYYTQYNQSVGKIYLELVRVRRQMAEVLGYESFADYSYEIVYERDYSHEQGQAFLKEIRTVLAPLFGEIGEMSLPQHVSMQEKDLTAALSTAVSRMGGRIEEAFRFMTAYGLYDLTSTPEKFDSSFTTYLNNYEAPFLTVNSQGTSSDFVTFSHEFGHFTDSYVTYDGDEDLETAETFSQAMEFLALCYTEGVLTDSQIRGLLKRNLYETLDAFVFQAALADFEDRVYALDNDEITLDRINSIYRQCCKDYGIYDEGFDFYYTYRWFEVTHFFEVPYYVISYAVSADTALQVYEREKEESGAGLAAYERLLDRTAGDGVQTVMTEAGLENPFRAGALQQIAEFYRQEFNLS